MISQVHWTQRYATKDRTYNKEKKTERAIWHYDKLNKYLRCIDCVKFVSCANGQRLRVSLQCGGPTCQSKGIITLAGQRNTIGGKINVQGAVSSGAIICTNYEKCNVTVGHLLQFKQQKSLTLGFINQNKVIFQNICGETLTDKMFHFHSLM